MTRLLNDLLGAGWITELAGDDSRWNKITQASDALAKALAAEPQALIGATLAGLDPNAPADDPAMMRAEQALLGQWPTMRSVHVDPPVNLLRALLLDASVQAAADERAAIVWLTAADALPFVSLGRGERGVLLALEALANRAERQVFGANDQVALPPGPSFKTAPTKQKASVKTVKIDRARLQDKITAASIPVITDRRQNIGNPHWPGSHNEWGREFATRMAQILAEEIEAAAASIGSPESDALTAWTQAHNQAMGAIGAAFESHRQWVDERLKAMGTRHESGGSQVSALWWSQALYSPTTRTSYRRLPPAIAAVTMAHDLAAQVPAPCAASVGYLLAETTTRLPDVTFTDCRPIREWLEAIAGDRERLPEDHRAALRPPTAGHLSFDDLATLALKGADLTSALQRTPFPPDAPISLPDLAHAIFHHRQARDLAARLS